MFPGAMPHPGWGHSSSGAPEAQDLASLTVWGNLGTHHATGIWSERDTLAGPVLPCGVLMLSPLKWSELGTPNECPLGMGRAMAWCPSV